MGEGVFGSIVKGPVHQLVDRVVNDQKERAAFLAGLRSANDAGAYITLLRGYGLTLKQADYLLEWWYDEPKSFWPNLQPIYQILKRGLIKAIEVADEVNPALPIDSYWSPSGPVIGGTGIQVLVTRSQYQVTRIILTPVTPPPKVQRTKDAPMWVVSHGDSSLKPGDFPNKATISDEVVEAVDGDVITWRIRDFDFDRASSVSSSV
jgi:hypothetical protein